MLFRTSHDLERDGQWQRAGEEVIRLSVTRPRLWPVAALEIDRLVRQHVGPEAHLSFGAVGPSLRSSRWLRDQGWSIAADAFDPHRETRPDVIHQYHVLQTEQGAEHALAWAFENATGPEIDALDLLLATYFANDEALWTRFLNRYLSTFGHCIGLGGQPAAHRFLRLESVRPAKAIESGPLVSVLMPVFNARETLQHAAGSILNQSWRNLELILVNDASTDDSWSLCEAIARQDGRVRLHRNPANAGPYVSKNVGLHLARGGYITCHDADDWAFPDRIAHQVGLLSQADSACRATAGQMLRLQPDGRPSRPARVGALSDDGFSRQCFVSLIVGAGGKVLVFGRFGNAPASYRPTVGTA